MRWTWTGGDGSARQAIYRYDLPSGERERVTLVSQERPLDVGQAAIRDFNQVTPPSVSDGRVWWVRWGKRNVLIGEAKSGKRKTHRLSVEEGSEYGAVPVEVAVTRRGTYFSLMTPASTVGSCGDSRNQVRTCGVFRMVD